MALVDKNVDRHGTRALAQAYLEYLYTPEGQEIAARNFYRPRLKSVADKYAAQFPKLKLFGIDSVWRLAEAFRRPISPTAGSSTRSISRVGSREEKDR